MTEPTTVKSPIGKDTAFFLAMLAVTVCASAFGFWLGDLIFEGASTFRISFADPYSSCQLPVEYLGRCALLCRPFLLDTAVLLLLACSRFEYLLSSVYFLIRGIAFGGALYVGLHTVSTSALLYVPIVYISVTLMYLIYSRMLRTRSGPCARSDALVFALITAGAVSSMFMAVSLCVS